MVSPGLHLLPSAPNATALETLLALLASSTFASAGFAICLATAKTSPAVCSRRVWDGAVVLAQYLTSACSPLKQYKETRAEALQRSAQHAEPCQAPQQPQEIAQQVVLQQQSQEDHPHPSQASDLCQCQQEFNSPSLPRHTSQQRPLQKTQDQEQPPEAEPCNRPLPGFTCLELGAGTGAVSLSLLAAGTVDYALLTDIPDMLPHLQSNVQHNSSVLDPQKALVLPLRWAEAADVAALHQLGQQQQRQHQRLHMSGYGMQQLPVQLQPPFEFIVGSDLIYYRYDCACAHCRRGCHRQPQTTMDRHGFASNHGHSSLMAELEV